MQRRGLILGNPSDRDYHRNAPPGRAEPPAVEILGGSCPSAPGRRPRDRSHDKRSGPPDLERRARQMASKPERFSLRPSTSAGPPNRGVRHRCVPLNGRPIFLHAPYSRQGFFSGTANRNLSPAPLRREGAGETISRSEKKDRKSTRLNSSHSQISYAVFCLKKKKDHIQYTYI